MQALEPGCLVFCRYWDHVLFRAANPRTMMPQTRECVGWLVYRCPEYVTVSWDRDAGSPTLKGGDSKASGLVILRGDILEMRRVNGG